MKAGLRTSLVLNMKKMMQRNSKIMEIKVRGFVGSDDKLCFWTVNEGKGGDWDPILVFKVALLTQMMDIGISRVVGKYKYG